MKKLISLTLAIMMVLTLAVPAMAEDAVDTTLNSSHLSEGNIKVSASIGSSYTITIPASVELGSGASAVTKTVDAAAGMKVPNGQAVHVSVASANGWKLKTDKGDEWSYTLTCGQTTCSSGTSAIEITSFSSSDNAQSASLSIKAGDVPANANSGAYSDTLTFTIGLK